jgi:uncharacterized protein (TIGR04255 family)
MGKQLKHKPLVEALVELKWSLPDAPSEGRGDVYPLLLGRLHERVREDYPYVEPLPAANVPDQLTSHMVKYRLRTSRDGWPLLQVGPGVSTLNFTDSYDWERFSEEAKSFFSKLLEAYAVDGDSPRPEFTSALLRYINALEFDPANSDVLDCLAKRFNTRFLLPEGIHSAEQVQGSPVALQIAATYPLAAPPGTGTIRFTTGAKKGKPAIIWESNILSVGNQTPQDAEAFEQWLRSAHDVAETWFFAIIKGELEELFDKGDA